MLYDVLVGLHVASAVIGFGAVALSGVYGAIARRDPAGDEAARFFAKANRAEYLVIVVPFLGLAALLAGPNGSSRAGQLWVVIGALVWLFASVLLIGVVRPAEMRLRSRQGDDRLLARSARDLARAGVAMDVLFVVALMMMVTQPR